MTEGPLTAQARTALREFTRLLADRARRQAQIAQALEASLTLAKAQHQQATGAANEARDRDTASARARDKQDRTDVLGSLDEQLAAADKHRQTEAAVLAERAGSDDAAIAKWLTDKVWMADSVYESASPKPSEQFEATRKELTAAADHLRRLEQEAAAHLRACHMGRLPHVPPPEDAARWSEGEASKRLAEMSKAVGERSNQLHRAILPRLFITIWPVLYTILFAGGGLATAAALTDWQNVRALTIGAGSGAATGIAILIALYFLAKRRIADTKAGFAHALAAARAAVNRWLEIAGENRRRSDIRLKETHEFDARSARTKAAAKSDEITKARKERLAAINAGHAQTRTALTAQRDERAQALEARLADEFAAINDHHSGAIRTATQQRDAAIADDQQAHDREWSALVSGWTHGMATTHALAAATSSAVNQACQPWSHESWDKVDKPGGWTPPAAVPPAVCIGELSLDLSALPGGLPGEQPLAVPGPSTVALPVAMELPDRCSLLLRTGGQGRDAAISLLQATMLRLLTSFPPGKVRFTIIDPVGLGQNFAAFMHLADYEPAIVSDRIWTEPRHIEQRLTDLTEHMENVIQKYLRNQFRTIEEYNVHAGEVAEPYRFLVIADLPTSFNELAAKRLASILDSGPRCGVYTLIAHDTRLPLPQGLTQADLGKSAVQLSWKTISKDAGPERSLEQRSGSAPNAQPPASVTGAFVRDDPEFSKLPLTIEAPPSDDLFNRLVHMAGRHAKDSSRVQVPFEMIAPPVDQGEAGLWPLSSAKDVVVPMGRAGATKLQHMTLGRGTAQHALIAGRTGSGKSTLFHAIITSLATWYGPDEIELYLVDFKKGVEFKTYASHEIPHARVIAIESEREFGLSVLRRLDGELKRRGELFRTAEVQDIASFRARNPGVRMPRVLLIIDEFQELFVEDDKLAQEASLLLDRLVRQGRAFGMHAVLGSQTLGGAYSLARSTIGQMAVRIALQCSEADSYLILSDDNPAARLLSRPGEAIYNDASGAIEGNNPFQVAWLPEDKRERYLDMVQSRYQHALSNGKTGSPRPEPAIIFEGSAPANVERNQLLNALLEGRSQPRLGALHAWIGEPIAIKEPTAAVFRRQSAANLLIVGQKDESAMAMFATGLISLGAQSRDARLLILDGTPADAPTAGYLDRVAKAVGTAARVVPYREVEPVLAEVAAEVDRRAHSDATDAPPIFILIYGLQRFRMLRRPENEFDFGSAEAGGESADKRFLRILREGPALGIHTLVWADTVSSVNRTLERNALREFDQRVLFQMSATDSSALIDVASAGLIGANRALFYSEEQGTVEKFRPYALPDDQWLARVATSNVRA